MPAEIILAIPWRKPNHAWLAQIHPKRLRSLEQDILLQTDMTLCSSATDFLLTGALCLEALTAIVRRPWSRFREKRMQQEALAQLTCDMALFDLTNDWLVLALAADLLLQSASFPRFISTSSTSLTERRRLFFSRSFHTLPSCPSAPCCRHSLHHSVILYCFLVALCCDQVFLYTTLF